jgi:hypothetical protein
MTPRRELPVVEVFAIALALAAVALLVYTEVRVRAPRPSPEDVSRVLARADEILREGGE